DRSGHGAKIRQPVALICLQFARSGNQPAGNGSPQRVENAGAQHTRSPMLLGEAHRAPKPATSVPHRAGSYIAFSSFTSRAKACSRAVLFAGFVLPGSSPARMNPCPAPSYVTGSYTFPAFFIASVVPGTVAPTRASLPA